MNKREYLVSIGLAKGTRGKFSKDAEQAWEDYCNASETLSKIDDVAPPRDEPELPRDGLALAKLPPVHKIVRKENMAYTIDEFGRMIGHGTCGTCLDRISVCTCPGGPDGLRYIRPVQKAYLVKKDN